MYIQDTLQQSENTELPWPHIHVCTLPFLQHLAGDEFGKIMFTVTHSLPPETVLLIHDCQYITLLERQSGILERGGREGGREGGTCYTHTHVHSALRVLNMQRKGTDQWKSTHFHATRHTCSPIFHPCWKHPSIPSLLPFIPLSNMYQSHSQGFPYCREDMGMRLHSRVCLWVWEWVSGNLGWNEPVLFGVVVKVCLQVDLGGPCVLLEMRLHFDHHWTRTILLQDRAMHSLNSHNSTHTMPYTLYTYNTNKWLRYQVASNELSVCVDIK